MTAKMKTPIRFTAKCRAFSCEGVKNNTLILDTDGKINVLDSVAGHYTRCHILTPRTQRRLAKLAV